MLGLLFLISGPSMLIAFLKLRRRNMGPILDANGWAVNALTKVNLPLGRSLTGTAALPPGAERSLVDPYAEKRRLWPRVLLVLLLLGAAGFGLWKTGYLSDWLGWVPRPETQWLRPRPATPIPGCEVAPASPGTASPGTAPGTAPTGPTAPGLENPQGPNVPTIDPNSVGPNVRANDPDPIPKNKIPEAPGQRNPEYAIKVEGKAGYVKSPYDTQGRLIDVRGLPPGTEAECPYTHRTFLVPP